MCISAWVSMMLLIAFIPTQKAQSDETPQLPQPRLREVVLQFQEKRLRPVRIERPWVEEHPVGSLVFRLNGGELLVKAKASGDVVERASADSESGWRWLGSDDDHAYLTEWRDQRPDGGDKTQPARIYRFSASTGKREPDAIVKIEAGETASSNSQHFVQDALTGHDRLIVLTTTAPGRNPTSYHVTAFRNDSTEPVWQHTSKFAGSRPGPGVFMWGVSGPRYASSAIRGLSWLEDRIIVCAGPMEDILYLSKDGKLLRRTEKVWEFERGFVGPSVWQHYMRRIGRTAFMDDGKVDEKAVKTFYERFRSAIIGGPIVTRAYSSETGFTEWRVFVAVSRGDARGLAGYVSDCVVYEIDDVGKVIAMVNVPRMIHGDQYAIDGGAVVWACDENGYSRFAHSKRPQGLGMGPGGPDCIARIDWYRDLDSASPATWLTTDKVRDPVAFTDSYAYRVRTGGFVEEADKRIYRFPLLRTELADGRSRDMMLIVPMSSPIGLPDVNYSSRQLADGSMTTHIMQPHLAGITQLQVIGDELCIVLGLKNHSVGLYFSLRELE